MTREDEIFMNSPEEKFTSRIANEVINEYTPALLINKYLEGGVQNQDRLIRLIEKRIRSYDLRRNVTGRMGSTKIGKKSCLLGWGQITERDEFGFILESVTGEEDLRKRLIDCSYEVKVEICRSIFPLIRDILEEFERELIGNQGNKASPCRRTKIAGIDCGEMK
jgi:hypothetical protein